MEKGGWWMGKIKVSTQDVKWIEYGEKEDRRKRGGKIQDIGQRDGRKIDQKKERKKDKNMKRRKIGKVRMSETEDRREIGIKSMKDKAKKGQGEERKSVGK